MNEANRAAQSRHAVVCKGLSKEFGDGTAKSLVLRNLDLTIQDSEMTLIVGPSGCGKTTLISIIAGLLRPTQGHVSVLGIELAKLSEDALVEFRCRNLGFVFQQYNLLPALTAVENAAIPLMIQGQARSIALSKAAVLLRQLGLDKRLDALPRQLSGGEQQRVAFARALVHEPRLMVCDEPTAALDATAGRKVMELLRAVAVMPGRSVLVVTHDSRVLELGDTLVHVSDGQVEKIEPVQRGRQNGDMQ